MWLLCDYRVHGVDTYVDRWAKYKVTCVLCKVCAEAEETPEHEAYNKTEQINPWLMQRIKKRPMNAAVK
jgi:hypothetical protein